LFEAADPVVERTDPDGTTTPVPDRSLVTAERALAGASAARLVDDGATGRRLAELLEARRPEMRDAGPAAAVTSAAVAALAGEQRAVDLLADTDVDEDDGEVFLQAITIEALAAGDGPALAAALAAWFEVREGLLRAAIAAAPPNTVPPPAAWLSPLAAAVARAGLAAGFIRADQLPTSDQLPRALVVR
jgi:hypothetical protein